MSSSLARFYLTLAFQIVWRLVVSVFHGFRGRFRPILRAVGLGIVAFIGKDKPEPPKVLISQSRAVAVSRCAIHILPTVVSLFLISFNLQGYFIGSELQGNKDQDDVKSGVLQLAAKIQVPAFVSRDSVHGSDLTDPQELLIVSSLGTIIFHVLREELVFGDGLPLGLVISGWQFTQLSYFWSADFWGAIFCPSFEPRSYIKRLALLALIGISGLIAVMAGPAAAVLMLPAQRDFDIGGGVYWANGGDAELWPKVLDAEYYSSWNCSSLQNQLEQHQCPAAGFSTLHSHYLANAARPRTHVDYQITTGLVSKSIYVQPSAAYMSDTWAFTAHGPSARVHDLMRFLHLRSLDYLDRRQARTPLGLKNLKFSSKQRYTLETQIPAARTVCVSNGVVDYGVPSNLTLPFLDLSVSDRARRPDNDSGLWKHPGMDDGYHYLDVFQDVREHLSKRGMMEANATLVNETSIFHLRKRIVAVPIDIWNGEAASSLGLVIFVKAEGVNFLAGTTNLLTCSIDARWVKAKTFIEMSPSSGVIEHDFNNGRVYSNIEVELDTRLNRPLWRVPLRATSANSTREGIIRLKPSWYESLHPPVYDTPNGLAGNISEGRCRTTLERILDLSFHNDVMDPVSVQERIVTTIVEALSRCGSIPNSDSSRFLEPLQRWRVGDTLSPPDETAARALVKRGKPAENFLLPKSVAGSNEFGSARMIVEAHYGGYAMMTSGWFGYFCIFILMAHAVMAITHLLVCIYSRRTGHAWSSILEFIALSYKSNPPPEHILSNTCAGVTSFKTVGSIAWVEETQETGGLKKVSGEGLSLIITDRHERRPDGLRPTKGNRYSE